MTHLIPMTDADYAWLLGEVSRDGLSVVEGGISPAEVITMLRGVTATVAATCDHTVAWLIAERDEAVGMISFTKQPAPWIFEFGYGVAPSREGRGHTSAAVASLVDFARELGLGLTAETSVANPASQRVLEKNGFVATGTRTDAEDGDLITWAHDPHESQA